MSGYWFLKSNRTLNSTVEAQNREIADYRKQIDSLRKNNDNFYNKNRVLENEKVQQSIDFEKARNAFISRLMEYLKTNDYPAISAITAISFKKKFEKFLLPSSDKSVKKPKKGKYQQSGFCPGVTDLHPSYIPPIHNPFNRDLREVPQANRPSGVDGNVEVVTGTISAGEDEALPLDHVESEIEHPLLAYQDRILQRVREVRQDGVTANVEDPLADYFEDEDSRLESSLNEIVEEQSQS